MIGNTGTPSRLRLARLRQGLTLEKAAVAAGMSVAWLRQVERDSSLLSDRIAKRLLPVIGLVPKAAEPEPANGGALQ